MRIRATDKGIFDAIRDGSKKIETRAATARYRGIAPGDIVTFSCDGARCVKRVKSVKSFKTLNALLRAFPYSAINPAAKGADDLRRMYRRFPGYEEKIAELGIVAFELVE